MYIKFRLALGSIPTLLIRSKDVHINYFLLIYSFFEKTWKMLFYKDFFKKIFVVEKGI